MTAGSGEINFLDETYKKQMFHSPPPPKDLHRTLFTALAHSSR